MGTYSEYGNGDISFQVESPVSGCNSGFWIGGGDPGAKYLLSILLSAKHSGSEVVIYGDKDRLWAGSGGEVCHVYCIVEY